MDCLELRIPPLPQLITAGHGIWAPGTQHFRRTFDVYDLIYVKQGALYMTEEDQAYVLEDGQLLLLEAGRTHWGHQVTDVPTELYWVHFAHPHSPKAQRGDDIPWSSPLRRGTDEDVAPSDQSMFLPKTATVDPGLLVPLLDQIVELGSTLSLQNALRWHIAGAELFERLQRVVMAELSSRSFYLSECAVQYLRDHMAQPFDSRQMESELHYHFDYISRCLRQYTGMSPLQYLHRLQIERARTLLVTTGLSIQEIGEQVGQPNGNYFIRLFRKHLGCPPGVYRGRFQNRA
ncbi:helix-turn-helix transcriptional regulator [Paenibacillus daejeonensis]|uniref:helix-turn-helix transcriptional regulator n=1 Tax=Paenibacillus daejeonensis TaxID=135193 RepID=UPI00035E44A9|nr:AraC family transcriptional regulator [Paenibacillus daejeonensis]